MGILIRLLLVISAFIAGLFVARDALNFEIVQMIVAVVLFTLIVFFFSFLPQLKDKFFKGKPKNK